MNVLNQSGEAMEVQEGSRVERGGNSRGTSEWQKVKVIPSPPDFSPSRQGYLWSNCWRESHPIYNQKNWVPPPKLLLLFMVDIVLVHQYIWSPLQSHRRLNFPYPQRHSHGFALANDMCTELNWVEAHKRWCAVSHTPLCFIEPDRVQL